MYINLLTYIRAHMYSYKRTQTMGRWRIIKEGNKEYLYLRVSMWVYSRTHQTEYISAYVRKYIL